MELFVLNTFEGSTQHGAFHIKFSVVRATDLLKGPHQEQEVRGEPT